MKAYVAGPMTGYPEHNFPAFDAAKELLESNGFEVCSPADIDRSFGITGNEVNGTIPIRLIQQVMLIEMQEILTCDAVVLLPGWENSKGSAVELAWAKNWRKPTFLLAEAVECLKQLNQSSVPPQTPATTPK